ncbi:TetR/AcrR family transcriptional regulator [Mycobacterium sp. 1245805.9]|uniref:TetR/AcrR family transcriptional regulator n=1 Tax=Mycobacterium sp. 1245805.9 TaxID=1856862 RepID=UPI0008011C87|nr:TetR/AcrR family transcriptional regulator [Mycobacterium sp. 1245805.9]OBI92010.1 TetR family transcriptional regulator [Mycobacterium sp. 1245805.9]
MTRPSYAERRKLQLREEIIDAAIDVFAESGYHDAGVADIAKRVGIGHSTFYRHFENKRAILDEVINTVIERFMAALAAENAPDAANSLDEYRDQAARIGAALADISSDIRAVRLLLIEAASVDTDLRQRVDDLFDLAVQVNASFYQHGREHGYLRADLDTTATSRAVIGMIFGLAMMGLNPAFDNDERENTIQAAVRLMFDGISNHSQKA